MRIRNLRPTPGVLIGAIALVFAFTGAAVAAGEINTNDIAKKTVTGSRIAKDAVKSAKIADGKIKAKDLARRDPQGARHRLRTSRQERRDRRP